MTTSDPSKSSDEELSSVDLRKRVKIDSTVSDDHLEAERQISDDEPQRRPSTMDNAPERRASSATDATGCTGLSELPIDIMKSNRSSGASSMNARKSGTSSQDLGLFAGQGSFASTPARRARTPSGYQTTPLRDMRCSCSCLDWLAHALTQASTRYAQQRRPRRIFLVRHGQSLGNVDSTAYGRIPDNKVPLTDEGHEQATSAGEALARLIGEDESILALVSPYLRTIETLVDIRKGLGDRVKKVIHEPNLREQDFGNFQDPDQMNGSIKERQRFGRFFYRFPHGESGADVYSRVESFMSSLFRHMDNPNRAVHNNMLIVSHGIVMRMFLMRFFRWSVEEYERVYNPDNCAIWMLVANKGGEYSLVATPDDPHISAPVAGVGGQLMSLESRMSRCHNRTEASRVDDL